MKPDSNESPSDAPAPAPAANTADSDLESRLPDPSEDAPAAAPAANATPARSLAFRLLMVVVVLLSAGALVLSGLLWERFSTLQGQLAQQAGDAGATAAEARILARQTQEQERELAARLAVMEARLGELSMQRTQLDELMQSLTRTREETLVVDIESTLRLAQQQARLSGSVEPLLAALRSSEQRLSRVAQVRLAPVQRALASDMARIKAAPHVEVATLLVRLDELVKLADEIPLTNAMLAKAPAVSRSAPAPDKDSRWWERSLSGMRDELRSLVRISRIDHPDAVLISPEQAYFVRENLKLLFLSARFDLLARQPEAAKQDIDRAAQALKKYFDASARQTQTGLTLVEQLQSQLQSLELPRIDATLAALAAVSGR